MDRSAPGGNFGILFQDVASALINTPSKPIMTNKIYGLGGRDMTVIELEDIFKEANENVKKGKLEGAIQEWIGVRGPELKYYNVEGK
jgi:pyruvate ferredoxin oxidoreductase alpha subunit